MSTNPTRAVLPRRLAHLLAGSSLVALALVATHGSAQAQFVCSGYYTQPEIVLLRTAEPSLAANALGGPLGTQIIGDGGSFAFDYGSMACGLSASANGPSSTAVGNGTYTGPGERNTALGSSARAGGFSYGTIGEDLDTGAATAVGGNSYASLRATVVGANAAGQLDAATFGSNAYATDRATAVGTMAGAYGANSVVVGYAANDGNLAKQVVVGSRAYVNATDASGEAPLPGLNVALGADSAALRGSQSYYAAYGYGKPAYSIGEVSVGTSEGNRQITGVAPGSAGSDAVNVDQLRGAIDNAGFGQGGPIAGLNTSGLGFPVAAGVNATAAGWGAVANGRNSVALGSGSLADRDDTVSVGAVGAERVIANVGAARIGTDAVNLDQLNAMGVQVSSISGTVGTMGGRISVLERGVVAAPGGITYPVSADNAVGAGAPTSLGANALAVGYGAQADAANSVAVGAGSVASQANTVSFGSVGNARRLTNVAAGIDDTDAVNLGQVRAVVAALPVAAYVPVSASNASNLARPVSSGDDALALGYGAQATGTAALAVGRSTASGTRSAALGDGAAASGASGLALGSMSSASGTSATALGDGSSASGQRSAALGAGSRAGAANSTAVGAGAEANNANSTAVGAGARTTRANQVAIGTSNSTYTMGGVASANSRAQQTGPAYFATTDSQGNLAATSFDTNRIETMDNHINAVDARVGNVEGRVAGIERNVGILRNDIRRTGEGVSIAMAMAGVQLPSEKTYSISANWGYFEGENGLAATGAARLNESLIVHAGVGVGANRGTVGARAGITYGW